MTRDAVDRKVERYWGPLFAVAAAPMPEGALRRICRKESGGMPEIVIADKVLGASELGGFNLVVEHDVAANPRRRSTAGAIGADVDPLTPLGCLWGAQWVYQRAKDQFTADFEERKIITPSDADVAAWIAIMHAQHSIGAGGFRVLLYRGAARGLRHPIAILDHFARRELPPAMGKQSPALVRKRIKNLLALPKIAATYARLPYRIAPLSPRSVGVPVFNRTRAKLYILAERERLLAKPVRKRQPNGSPFPA